MHDIDDCTIYGTLVPPRHVWCLWMSIVFVSQASLRPLRALSRGVGFPCHDASAIIAAALEDPCGQWHSLWSGQCGTGGTHEKMEGWTDFFWIELLKRSRGKFGKFMWCPKFNEECNDVLSEFRRHWCIDVMPQLQFSTFLLYSRRTSSRKDL